jgi:hypothetical protein
LLSIWLLLVAVVAAVLHLVHRAVAEGVLVDCLQDMRALH